MAYATPPPTLYDEVIETREYPTVNSTKLPIREDVITAVAEHEGKTELELERPDGTTHTLSGDTPIPDREQLVDDLIAAQRAFDDLPVSTLNNLYDGRLGPLHYTDTTAHFTVSESIFSARPQRGTGGVPEQFTELGVKAAHLKEGFEIAASLPHHWADDLGWEITQTEQYQGTMGDGEIPEDRAPPADECFVINVPSVFPAASFGRATDAPAEIVTSAISRTERLLDETLLTKRMAQLQSIEQYHTILQSEIDRGLIDSTGVGSVDEVAQDTFGISASGVASLRSQMNERKTKAFETVRRLSDSDDFNYVMEEFAETIDELGELAMLGTQYREEVLDKPPGFY